MNQKKDKSQNLIHVICPKQVTKNSKNNYFWLR